MTDFIQRLAITPGEPAGIGPDLVVRLAANLSNAPVSSNPPNPPLLKGGLNLPLLQNPPRLKKEAPNLFPLEKEDPNLFPLEKEDPNLPPLKKGGRGGFQLVAVADPDLLAARAQRLGLALEILPFDPAAAPQPSVAGQLHVLPVKLRQPVTPGQLNSANADYVLETLARACDGCLDGTFAGVVTAPVHKGVINDAGLPFTGHTEFFAERCAAQPVMLLATPELRVALVTTHLPLTEVSRAITAAHLTAVIRILHRDLVHRFGITAPRILVCGLNPHAGEGGHLGREEIDTIIPVLETLRAEGMQLIGPLPADTAFVPSSLANADAVLAMYHDQGLPVLKHLGFGRAVNVTLGLPIIRTSVDHGTALDLAGTDRADLGSLNAAVALAQSLV